MKKKLTRKIINFYMNSYIVIQEFAKNEGFIDSNLRKEVRLRNDSIS